MRLGEVKYLAQSHTSSEQRNRIKIQVCWTPHPLLLTTIKIWVDPNTHEVHRLVERQINKHVTDVVPLKGLINLSHSAVIPIAWKLLSKALNYNYIVLIASTTGLLNLGTIDILVQIILCCRRYPVHYRMFSRILGFYPLETSSTHP